MIEKLKFIESIESKTAIVGKWVKNIGERQKVGEIPLGILRDVLTHYGANLENLTEGDKKSLQGYSEKDKGLGVRAVWGDDFVNEYKDWTKDFIEEYESKLSNRKLPELKPSGRKNSGMMQFLFELTALASGEMPSKTFKEYTEARVTNGKLWAENRSRERIRIKVPTADEPILLLSFPPEFPEKAWEWIWARKAD